MTRRALGLPMATALVVGNMVGSGVFLLPASLARFGGISIVGWLLTAVGALLLALVFARLSRLVPAAGGPYAYSRAGFGDFAGFLMAWGYWISICASNAAIAVAFVSYLTVFVPLLATNRLLAATVGVGALWLLTLVNAVGVRQAGAVQLVTTVLKLLPLIAVGTIGLLYVNAGHFQPFNASGASGFSAITGTLAFTLFAFLGLESATVPADDVDQPERTIPRATLIGTSITALVYIVGTVAVMGIVPREQLALSTAPFADAAASVWGGWAAAAVGLGAVISCFGALNGWILLQGQVPFAAARDQLFPAMFARRSSRGTPALGLVISSVLVTSIMLMNYTEGLVEQFSFVILLATFTAVVPYALSSMAYGLLVLRGHRSPDLRSVAGSLVMASLAFAYSVWAVAGAGRDAVYWGFLALIGGVPVYVWMKRQNHSGRREVR